MSIGVIQLTPNPLPKIKAIKYAPTTPNKIGIIFVIPFPKILKKITIANAIIASGQHVTQLFSADGAKQRPIAIIIGPVTTGGNNFITFETPINLIHNASTKYSKPAKTTPKHAYGNISKFAEPSFAIGATVAYPPKNANDEPKNAGTLNFVNK